MPVSWAREVVHALEGLGGVASYAQIYDYIEQHATRPLTPAWRATVRQTIQSHSSDTDHYRGGADLFHAVEGLHKGVWGLRPSAKNGPSVNGDSAAESSANGTAGTESESPADGASSGGSPVAIPDFQTLMLPLLELASDGHEHSIHDATNALATQFRLSEQDRNELLPSGRQRVFDNRVGWARTYLQKAGLLEATRRTYFRIAPPGTAVLRSHPPRVDVRFLHQFPEFQEFQRAKRPKGDSTGGDEDEHHERTPDEALEESYLKLRQELAHELLARVMAAPPEFFERLVVDLLVSMGYGGSIKDAGQAIGRSGDGGIDGIIKEDRLGLDVIYIQAKRWQGTVGSPEIQQFMGALGGHHAKKGVFITTSGFSNAARDYVARVDWKIVLVDGQQLAQLMIDNNVGVSMQKTYEVKRIDSDYFPEA